MINAAVYGASGLTGFELTKILSQHKDVGKIYAIARSKINHLPNNVFYRQLDINNIEVPNDVEIVFCCLGTTLKKAGSVEEFRKVDHNAVVNLAHKAQLAGVKTMVVISSIGANAKSRNYYLRTKGETDEELLNIEIPNIFIVRPSLIAGLRNEKRLMEKVAGNIFKVLKFILAGPLRKYRPIHASRLANAMLNIALKGHNKSIIESIELQKLSQLDMN